MSRNNWTDEKLINRLINNKTNRTYWANVYVLRTRPTLYVFEKCEQLVKSDISKERLIGIHILDQLTNTDDTNAEVKKPLNKEKIKIFFEQLQNENDINVLESILYAIGHNNENLSKVQIEKLCKFANTQHKTIKVALIFSLLGIENIKAIQVLIAFSKDKNIKVRNWATFGLGSLTAIDNKEIREALLERTHDKDEDTRFEALVGLAKRKDDKVKEIILKELEKEEFGSLLFEAILEIGDKDILTILQNQYKNSVEDKSIDSTWLSEMKNCIKELEEKLQ